jgi:hypothetical protein
MTNRFSCPAGTHLDKDTGFQGDPIPEVILYQPKKKPRGRELAKAEKVHNRLISRVRVVIEHLISGVKRCRIVKDIFRNIKDDLISKILQPNQFFAEKWRRLYWLPCLTEGFCHADQSLLPAA